MAMHGGDSWRRAKGAGMVGIDDLWRARMRMRMRMVKLKGSVATENKNKLSTNIFGSIRIIMKISKYISLYIIFCNKYF
jgi:hypothetical protein